MTQAFKGDYKWILYGDDDTFFFVDGVLELLQDFDPSLPYFITGMGSAQTLSSNPQLRSTVTATSTSHQLLHVTLHLPQLWLGESC